MQTAQDYLLSGLIRCGQCGGPMCGSTKRRGGKLHRYYRCNAGVCTAKSVRADRLEDAVLAECDMAAVEQVTVRGLRAELACDGRAPVVLDLVPNCDLETCGGRLRHWRLSSGRTTGRLGRHA